MKNLKLILLISLTSLSLAKAQTLTTINKQGETCIDGVPLFIDWLDSRFEAGDTAIGNIILGTASDPVDSIYSIAFKINYNNQLIKQDSLAVDFSNSWIPGPFIPITNVDDNWQQGEVDIFLSRSDQTNSSGSGPIGSIIIIIDDNIQGVEVSGELIAEAIFTIDSVNASTFLGNTVSVCPEESSFTAFEIILSTTDLFETLYNAYPNPSTSHITVKSKKDAFEKIRILNTLGQVVLEQNYFDTKETILDLSTLHKGSYFLQLVNNKGEQATSKISIRK